MLILYTTHVLNMHLHVLQYKCTRELSAFEKIFTYISFVSGDIRPSQVSYDSTQPEVKKFSSVSAGMLIC